MRHNICLVEWTSTDLERTCRFFSELFEWQFERFSADYRLFHTPEGGTGGVRRVDRVDPGTSPMVYVEVEQLEPYLERVPELGGRILEQPREVPGTGWYAHVESPDGNRVGLFLFAGR